MRWSVLSMVLAGLVVLGACDLVDPIRPTEVDDTEVFGNLLEVTPVDGEPSTWTVTVRAGAPRALRTAEQDQGRPTPAVEKGLVVTVGVTADTVVVADDRPAALDQIDSGTEVVVLPVPGTPRMLGPDDLRLDAQVLMDFETYRRWRLPKLGEPAVAADDDVERINSSGSELAPVPVGDGSVLYFTARLRPPATAEDGWHGAPRDGLEAPAGGEAPRTRSYRTELGDDGWSTPELVEFPGLDDAEAVQVSWVGDDETRCLLTVREAGNEPYMAESSRADGVSAWGTPQRLEALGVDAGNGVYLTGSRTKIVLESVQGGNLLFFDPANEDGPLPLEPQINTFGREWNPRTGPEGELFFCREDRQLVFKSGRVRPLRLPGPHRVQFTQAAPSDDGRWLFFCMPRYRPLELDHDIHVASLDETLAVGAPVPVDEWRP